MVAASNELGAMAAYAQRVIAAAPLIAESLYRKSPPRGGLALWHAFVRQLHLQDDRCQHDHTEARRGATCWFGLLLLEKPHHRAVICLSCTGQPSQRISEARCTCLWWPPRWNSYGMESWDLNDARTKHNLWPSLTFPNDILIRVRIPTRVSMLLVNSMSHDPNQKISRSLSKAAKMFLQAHLSTGVDQLPLLPVGG